MKRLQRDTALGIVFFGTMAFLLWATVNLTDISVGAQAPLQVYFADAGGIRVGDPVLLLGKPVGKVAQIDFVRDRPKDRMRITLRAKEDLALTQQASIQIQDSGVLGGKQVYIDPGQGLPLPTDRDLVGTTSGNALAAAGKFFDGDGPSGKELREALTEIRRFFQNLNNPETSSVGALIHRRDIYDEVERAAKSVNRLLDAVQNGEGFLGSMIMNRSLREDAARFVGNLAQVSDRLNRTDNALGRLLNDTEMADQLGRLSYNLDAIANKAAEGRGIVGRLVHDEALAEELSGAIRSLASVLRKADDPAAGALGTAFGDQQLKDDLKNIVGSLRSVAHKIDEGNGTLSVLINDEDMAIRLRRILTQVSRALEDAREAAPIGTFVQVLFGAF